MNFNAQPSSKLGWVQLAMETNGSNVKERIIGAVTIMSEEEAEKVWNLIQASFILSDVEEIEPDPEELEALRRYEAGQPDYQPSISAENLKRELGL